MPPLIVRRTRNSSSEGSRVRYESRDADEATFLPLLDPHAIYTMFVFSPGINPIVVTFSRDRLSIYL